MVTKMAEGVVVIVVGVAGRQGGSRKKIGDLHEFIGIGTLVAAGADRRGHGVDINRPIAIEVAGDVTATVGCGIEGSRVVGNAIWDTDIHISGSGGLSFR
jgi:hypothetical protein